jgi:hypothetical protein
MPLFGFTNIPGSVITQTSIAVASGGASDPDAQAFITAASITDATEISAVDQLVIDLKSYNIWTKMKAIYPVLGGSASSHAVNLVTPGTYNLTFSTGWTHASTGMTPNGAAYADSSLIPSSVLSQNSKHISFYSRTNTTGAEVEIGSATGAGASDAGSLLEIRTTNTTYFRINSAITYITYVDSDSRGFYVGNRTASNVINGWRNSTKVANGTTASNGLSTRSIWIGGLNQASTPFYSTKQCAFASIGDGLTDTEAANFYTAVNAYQTTLSRNV